MLDSAKPAGIHSCINLTVGKERIGQVITDTVGFGDLIGMIDCASSVVE